MWKFKISKLSLYHFSYFTERKVEEDINTCNGFVLLSDPQGLSLVLQSLVGRSRRVAKVAERIVDGHDDAVFRNGLMVFIKQLCKGRKTQVSKTHTKSISEMNIQAVFKFKAIIFEKL